MTTTNSTNSTTQQERQQYVSVSDIAAVLGVSDSLVRSLIRRKEIPAVKLGHRCVRVPRAAVTEFLARRNTMQE